MTAADRPWWASDGPADGDAAPDEDPLERHRRARRGESDPQAPTGADGDGTTGESASDPAADHDVDVCGVCPICTGLRSLVDARPELAGHLAEAARHLAAALREVLEHPGDRTPGEDDEGVQRIDLD